MMRVILANKTLFATFCLALFCISDEVDEEEGGGAGV